MDVRLDDGRIIKNVPEGTTQEALRAKLVSAGLMEAETIDQVVIGDPTPPVIEDAETQLPEGGLIDSILEPVKAIAGDITGAVVGGLGGIAATPFGSDAASGVVGDIQQDFSSPPQTKSGQQSLQAIQDLVQKGIDVASVPQALLGGLIDMSIRGDSTEAIKTAIDIHQEGVVPLAQEATFQATDSPLAATAVGVVPEIAGALFPFAFGRQTTGAGQLTRKDATNLEATRQRAKDSGFNQDTTFESNVQQDQQRAFAIAQKSPDKSLAKFTIDKRGNLIDDDLAIEAIKQGIDPAVVQSIKNMGRLDKVTARKMVRSMKKGMVDAEFRIDNRPSDLIGDSLKKKVVFLKRKNTEAGQDLNKVAESLKGEPVDLTAPVNNFSQKLEEFGIGLADDGQGGFKPDFTETSLAPGDRGPIKEVIRQMNRLSKNGNPDAFTAHQMKRIIDRNVTFGKTPKGGLSGEAEAALKSFRRDLDSVLDDNFPRYDHVNTQFKDTVEAINALRDVSGTKADLLGETADRTLGVLTRRIASNAASGAPLGKAIKDINNTVIKYGGKVHDNINAQLTFSDMLNTRFKPETNTSFQADIGKEVQRAAGQSKIGLAAEGVDKVVSKLSGVSDENAIKAIEKLLRRP